MVTYAYNFSYSEGQPDEFSYNLTIKLLKSILRVLGSIPSNNNQEGEGGEGEEEVVEKEKKEGERRE